MKNRAFAVLLLLVAACGSVGLSAQAASPGKYASDMAVNADTQADFFKRYPDLQDEAALVANAARALAAEGEETRNDQETAELLAKRTRALLARRTPQEWQRKAVRLFPELGVKDSEFNTLFLRHFKALQQSSPQFMEEPSWPVLLARRCADELRPKTPANVAAAQSVPAAAEAAVGSANPARGKARLAKWGTAFSLMLLLAIVVQPALLLFRCRRAFAGSGGPVTLWQSALGPAAWGYLAVALTALARTFSANADQGVLDRFGITLLVSLAAGVVLAVPVYAIALGAMAWWRRRTPAAPQAGRAEIPAAAVGRKP